MITYKYFLLKNQENSKRKNENICRCSIISLITVKEKNKQDYIVNAVHQDKVCICDDYGAIEILVETLVLSVLVGNTTVTNPSKLKAWKGFNPNKQQWLKKLEFWSITEEQIKALILRQKLTDTSIVKIKKLNSGCYTYLYDENSQIIYIPDNVTDLHNLFAKYPLRYNIRIIGGRNLQDALQMFDCTISWCIDISNFYMENIRNADYMFRNAVIRNIDFRYMSKVKFLTMEEMFELTRVHILNLSQLQFEYTPTNYSFMFCKCRADDIVFNDSFVKYVDMYKYKNSIFEDCKAMKDCTDIETIKKYNLNQGGK